MKRSILVIFSVILVVLMVSGCASEYDEIADSKYATNESQEFKTTETEVCEDSATDDVLNSGEVRKPTADKIIYNVSFDLYVEDVKKAKDSLNKKTAEYGGYVSNSRYNEYDNGRIEVHMEVKIPSKDLEKYLKYVDTVGNVKSKNKNSQNITEQYYDIQSRLKNARRQEAKLLEIMEKAETVEDILKVQQQIDVVQERIERLQGQINLYDKLVAYSTINFGIYPVEKMVNDSEDNTRVISLEEVWNGIKKATTKSAKFVVNFLGYLLIALFYALIPGVIIALIVIFIIRRRKKKRKKQSQNMQQPAQQQPLQEQHNNKNDYQEKKK